jgi:hypothetical protein
MNMETEWMNAISEITAIGGVFVSIIAVFIAAKSASASNKSAEIAEKILRRSGMRELMTGCHSLIAEELRIQSLVIELNSEYSTLATFQGALGGSREKIVKDGLDKDLLMASEGVNDAKRLVKDQQQLILASDFDIDRMLIDVETKKTELQTIREAMERQLVFMRLQTQQHR